MGARIVRIAGRTRREDRALHRQLDRIEARLVRMEAAVAAPAPAAEPEPMEAVPAEPAGAEPRSAFRARRRRAGGKGWTPEKRREAYQRFGRAIIGIAQELDLPANELLAYVLKGDVPPEGRDAGFADTVAPEAAPAEPARTPEPEAEAAPTVPLLPSPAAQPPSRAPAAVAPNRHRRPPLTVAQIDSIRIMIADGATVAQLAEARGVSRRAIEHVVRIHGLPSPAAAPRGPRPDAERLSAVTARIAAGGSRQEMARDLGITASGLKRYADAHGLALPAHEARRPRQVHPETVALIGEMIAAGATIRQVQREAHVAFATVHAVIRREGIVLASPNTRAARAERHATMQRLYESGLDAEEVAVRCGVKRPAVLAAARRSGWAKPFPAAAAQPVPEPSPEPELGRNSQARVWTAERRARCKEMVDAGASAGQIAGALGTSRNAIIGIVSREGWKLAGQSGDTARAQRFAAKRSGAVKPRKPREKKVRAAPPPAPVASFPEPKKVRMARPAAGKVRLRHRDGARWLRMDGLGWVEDRRQSYLVDTAKLGKVRSAFPLAAECVAVPETPWKPRDGRDVRQSW